MARRRIHILAIAGVATLFGLAGIVWLRPAAKPVAAKAVPALTVTIATPRRASWPVELDASGAIFAWQDASIGTQIGPYRIADVRANVGDVVHKGQVLARLDPALLRAEEAQLVAARDQADANRRRATQLQGDGGISDQDVLQFVTQARTSDAQLAAKRLQLRYTAIVAPDDGTISARSATLGAVVPAGQELFRLIRQNRLEWRGELTAAQIAQIAVGQPIGLALPDGTFASARVRVLAPALDGQSRLGLAYADVAGGSHARAGMYANGRIIVTERPALTVPAASVVIRDGRSYVFALEGRSKVAKVAQRAVAIGRRRGDAIEIVGGLAGSERIAAEGAGFLNDGDIVLVAGQAEPTAHGGPGS